MPPKKRFLKSTKLAVQSKDRLVIHIQNYAYMYKVNIANLRYSSCIHIMSFDVINASEICKKYTYKFVRGSLKAQQIQGCHAYG